MKKIKAMLKKHWYLVAIGAFLIGVGSISGAVARVKTVAKNPATAVTK